jgi:hypothetical protein
MAVRIYIVPIIGTGTNTDPYRPKYVSDYPIQWGAMDYENHGWMLVAADVDSATHAVISGNSDVYSLPQDLDANLTSGQVTSVQNKLEAINIPGDWISSAKTWKQVIKLVAAIITLARRFYGENKEAIFTSGINLDMPISSLSSDKRQKLNGAAQSLGFDTSSIRGSDTLRTALRILAQQRTTPIFLNVVEI